MKQSAWRLKVIGAPILLGLWFGPCSHAHIPVPGLCGGHLAAENPDQLVALVSQYSALGLLPPSALNAWQTSLMQGHWQNPISHIELPDGEVEFESSADQLAYETLELFALTGQPLSGAFLKWLEQTIEKLDQEKIDRTSVSSETQFSVPFLRLDITDEPAPVLNINRITRIPTIPLEVMETPVTFGLWDRVMGKGLVRNGPCKEDNCYVVEVTGWSMMVFANRLSQHFGYLPAYNLDNVEFKGQPELGNLQYVSGPLTFNSVDNTMDMTSGFRLPSDVEQHYILFRRIKRADHMSSGFDSPQGIPLGDGAIYDAFKYSELTFSDQLARRISSNQTFANDLNDASSDVFNIYNVGKLCGLQDKRNDTSLRLVRSLPQPPKSQTVVSLESGKSGFQTQDSHFELGRQEPLPTAQQGASSPQASDGSGIWSWLKGLWSSN